MTPETMPTDEKENLIAATEENLRYWTQRIIDATERPFFKDDVEKVIRELLTADTHYAAAQTKPQDQQKDVLPEPKRWRDTPLAQAERTAFDCPSIENLAALEKVAISEHSKAATKKVCASTGAIPSTESPGNVTIGLTVHCGCGVWAADILAAAHPPASEATVPSVEELDKVYHNGSVISTLFIHHKEGLARVREEMLKAMAVRCDEGWWDKQYRHLQDRAEKAEGEANQWHAESILLVEKNASLRAEVEGLKRKLSEATDIMQRALDGAKELRLSAATWEKRYDEQTATAAKALEQRDTALAQLAKRQSALEAIANMPEHDQDDAHRLRHMAGAFVKETAQEPATVETCPTCGSAEKSVRESMSKPNCGPPLFPCQDAWHTPDPLAEVKAAFARGEKIQFKDKQATEAAPWIDTFDPQWNASCTYRIAPAPAWVPKYAVGDWVTTKDQPDPEWKRRVRNVDTLTKVYRLESKDGITLFGAWIESDLTPYTWQLPPGDWHRVDWTEDMLPRGYRPLLRSEKPNHDSEIYIAGYWCPSHAYAWSANNHARTRRPLPSPPKVEMPKIITTHPRPPIPMRSFDWCAYRDGCEETGPVGWGRTEAAAKADLLAQEEAR